MGKFLCGFVTGVASIVGLAIISDKIETKRVIEKNYSEKHEEANESGFIEKLKQKKEKKKQFHYYGLDKVKDVDKKILWEAFEELYPFSVFECLNVPFAIDIKEAVRNKIIKHAKSKMNQVNG